MKPDHILDVHNVLGEGILWDATRARLLWTDIQARALHGYDWASGKLTVHPTPERLGSFGLVAQSSQLIAAFASGVALYDIDAQTPEWLARPADVVPGIRFNDGRVDRRGRFWCGTMVEDSACSASARLYSIARGGKIRCHRRDIRISNGLCTSPDGTRLYFADSPTRTIQVYHLVEPEGELGAPALFARTPEAASPDGAAVDADGCLWSAHWGVGCVVRYRPDGRIDRTLDVPASQPSCVCFAGPQLDVLCVTSAREGLSEASLLQEEPHAGSVFLYRTGNQGLPEPEYLP